MKRLYENNFDKLFNDSQMTDIENITVQKFKMSDNSEVIVITLTDIKKVRIICKSTYTCFMLTDFNYRNKKQAIIFDNKHYDLQCYDSQLDMQSLVETCESHLQYVFDMSE
jgi:hypothetical protein